MVPHAGTAEAPERVVRDWLVIFAGTPGFGSPKVRIDVALTERHTLAIPRLGNNGRGPT